MGDTKPGLFWGRTRQPRHATRNEVEALTQLEGATRVELDYVIAGLADAHAKAMKDAVAQLRPKLRVARWFLDPNQGGITANAPTTSTFQLAIPFWAHSITVSNQSQSLAVVYIGSVPAGIPELQVPTGRWCRMEWPSEGLAEQRACTVQLITPPGGDPGLGLVTVRTINSQSDYATGVEPVF